MSNSAPIREFITYFGPNGRFLTNAFHRFFRDDLLALLAAYGVHTQTERGGRIFPTSGRAGDVRDALLRYASTHGAQIRYRAAVEGLALEGDRIAGVVLADGQMPADAVILATGGGSWPATGSTGDGYRMAQSAGHTIVPLRPSLVPLTVVERSTAKALQGVSLRNVACHWLERREKGDERELPLPYPTPKVGELLFTHFGVSGPLVLTASLGAVDGLRAGKQVILSIDLKPGMTELEVQSRLQREFEQYPHRQLASLLRGWVPASLADTLAQLSRIEPERHVHRIRAEERLEITRLLKGFRWTISGALPLAAGMVTAGGVALDEVDPVSLASRKVAGLYIVGETLDIDGDTGGFNLQAAFTTGYLAGQHAARG